MFLQSSTFAPLSAPLNRSMLYIWPRLRSDTQPTMARRCPARGSWDISSRPPNGQYNTIVSINELIKSYSQTYVDAPVSVELPEFSWRCTSQDMSVVHLQRSSLFRSSGINHVRIFKKNHTSLFVLMCVILFFVTTLLL